MWMVPKALFDHQRGIGKQLYNIQLNLGKSLPHPHNELPADHSKLSEHLIASHPSQLYQFPDDNPKVF